MATRILTHPSLYPKETPCPECGGTMTKETGTISEPVIAVGGRIERRAYLGTFFACNGCENCVEVGR